MKVRKRFLSTKTQSTGFMRNLIESIEEGIHHRGTEAQRRGNIGRRMQSQLAHQTDLVLVLKLFFRFFISVFLLCASVPLW
jgi:hypothetical protein